ncbi:MAG: Rrf2 family transcriptional regulator [Thermacetogeniaceae bacterium]|nr:Rrf2 family transcriptional regulator [Syntrophomonadaceae bacterium]
MILNQATDYAFRAVLYLSLLQPGEIVEAKVIAENQHIPLRFLLKILRSLAKAGIVKSYQGVGGGYALGKIPADITLKDVLEAVEGSIRINKCLIDPDYCNKQATEHCPVHHVLASIQQTISQEFDKYNFEQLKEYMKQNLK